MMSSESSAAVSPLLANDHDHESAAAAAGSATRSAHATPRLSISAASTDKSGYMLKRSATEPHEFKRRWFFLQNNTLTYRASEESSDVRGTIELEGCSCELVGESKYGEANCFELNSPLQSRIVVLAADGPAELQRWTTAIRAAMLRIRRQKVREANEKKRQALEGAASETQQAIQQKKAAAAAATQPNSASHDQSGTLTTSASQSNTGAYPNPFSPDPLPPSSSAPHILTVTSSSSYQPPSSPSRPTSGSNGSSANPHHLDVYRLWLEESKRASRKNGGGSGGGPARSSMSSPRGELHHGLLDERQKKGTFEPWCGSICPAWCFR